MPIKTTGNADVDCATSEIAIVLRDAGYGRKEQDCYDEAMRLRDAIMAGTRDLTLGDPEAYLMSPTPLQLEKLPKWARDYIARLRKTLGDARAHIKALSLQGVSNSNVRIARDPEQADILLGINTAVDFCLGDLNQPLRMQDRITVQPLGHGVLELNSASGALHVTPQSSNVIRVRIGEF